MVPFRIVIKALPDAAVAVQNTTVAGVATGSLTVPAEFQATPLGVSFERAAEMLETFPRMHVEPDGSFVWVSSTDEKTGWQVDGNLYDRAGSLVSIDLKGTCHRTQFAQLLDVFRAEGRELMIELVREAVFLRETDFLKLL